MEEEIMKRMDLLVFDLDGTLVTSGGDIAASINYTLAVLGKPALEYSELLGYIGDGVYKLIEKSLGADYPEKLPEALHVFSAHYKEHMLDTTELYSGVNEILRYFRNKVKVIITNKRYQFTSDIVDAFHIRDFFDEIIGADTTPYIKPDARILQPLLERYGAAPDRTVVIGDGINDVLLAKNAGVVSCALLNGLGQRETLLALNPDYACEDLAGLMGLFS